MENLSYQSKKYLLLLVIAFLFLPLFGNSVFAIYGSISSPYVRISDITGDWSSYAPGAEINAEIKAINTPSGTSAAPSEGWSVQYYTYLASNPGPYIQSYVTNGQYNATFDGAYWHAAFPAPSTPGGYMTQALVYCAIEGSTCWETLGAAAESRAVQSTMSFGYMVTGENTEVLPNLTVDISLDDSNGLGVKHSNNSAASITTDQGNTYIWIDGKLVWTYTWFTYAPEKKLFMNPWTSSTGYPQVLEGTHVVKACIDANDIVRESDETDNCVTRTLVSRTLDNPVVTTTQRVLPDFATKIGMDLNNSVTIEIRGIAPVVLPTNTVGYTAVWLNGSSEPNYVFPWSDFEDPAFLKGNGKWETMILGEPIATIQTLKACVDYKDNVEESNERNNCWSFENGNHKKTGTTAYDPEVLGCISPLVPYKGECRDPIPACQNPPAHFMPSSCIDKIEDGKLIENYNFQCEKGYVRIGKECKAEKKNSVTTPQVLTNNTFGDTEFEDEVVIENVVEVNPFTDTRIKELGGKAAAYLYNQGIIGGFADKTFRGKNPVNRAEAAKFLLLTKYESINDISNNGYFSDVKNGQWYTKYVVTAAGLGIINGYSDATFKPANQVNTAEFLKMFAKTFGLTENLPYSYRDVRGTDWFAPFAGIAEKYELFPDRINKLQPARALTRYEVAVALYQYLSY